VTTLSFAMMSLFCGIGGWLIFLTLFCDQTRALVERVFPVKPHWLLVGLLLLTLACSISAIVFGHTGYALSHDGPIIGGLFLAGAALLFTYLFWLLFSGLSPIKRLVVLLPLLGLALLCSIGAIVLGYITSNTFMALAGLTLGYAQLPILAMGIVFAIIPS